MENKLDGYSEDELIEMLEYLDNLRDSGETNMFGAGSYLREEFALTRTESHKVLSYWMKTFGERHSKESQGEIQ